MCTLFVDTHGSLITVAIKKDDKLFVKTKESEASHSVYTLPMIEELFKENNIEFNSIKDIVVINGPGSFTGIRIGLSIVKTMAYALKVPVYVISSLKAYLVSSGILGDKKCVIEDNKGYYICIMDNDNNIILDETYLTDISEYDKYEQVKDELDVDKIISYTHKFESVNPYSIKANYVKKIDIEK